MAQKVSIELIDDLDGSNADETVSFSIDGKFYELDLSDKNAGKLRTFLGKYVEAARVVRPNGKVAVKQTDSKAVRAWAQSQGIDVPDRGRIPASVMQAYNAR